MKITIVFVTVFLWLVCTGLLAQQNALILPAPQFMLPFYDHFSLNYLNTASVGRGNTNMAHLGNLAASIYNPANLSNEKGQLVLEFTFKPPIGEMNEGGKQQFYSPIPFGMTGVSKKLFSNIIGGIYYSVPKSIIYDEFIVPIGQGADEVTRQPSYYLHELTTTLVKPIGNFRIGLNLLQQWHSLGDIVVHGTFDRLDRTYYVFNIQPGIFYKTGALQLGISAIPPLKKRFAYRYVFHDTTLPMQLSAGIGIVRDSSGLFFDVEFEQCSTMSERFKDRLRIKAGYEKTIDKVTYKAGVINSPEVFRGNYSLPIHNPNTPEEQGWWDPIPKIYKIGKSSQLLITGGFSYNFGAGELSMAVLQDVNGNVNCTQVMAAFAVNMDTFKGKKFLIFDK